ncbi:MAG: transglycosylase SLT domain-containing protein [Bacteriovoracaceae bacterium]|nr:transglycosylase SLT domain-containing protein [Bacteriovoracaceae bacterium]
MKTTKLFIIALILSLIATPVMPKSFSKAEVARYNVDVISKMIKVVQPDLKLSKRRQIALELYKSSKKFAVDPKIMVAIIATESNFNNDAVSSTGDLSLAQINTKVWDIEFKRLGLSKINIKRLKKDEAYALNRMGAILSILKARHAKKDNKWYATYHSKTKKHKDVYVKKVQNHLRSIAATSL